jgi:hypothetical protein
MTEHFTFFESYYKSVKDLPDDIKAEFYDVLFNYALYDNDISEEANPVVRAIFLMAKPNLDKSKARRDAGKQGGSKPQPKSKQTEANVSKSKQVPSDKDKDKEEDKENDKEKENKAFSFNLSKATQYNSLSKSYQDKLLGYAVVKDGSYQLQKFLDHNLAKGSKYKDWSRAYNTWVSNSIEYSKGDYNPNNYIKVLTNHPDYDNVYVPYGQNKAFSEEYDYICDFDVKETPKIVSGNDPAYNHDRDITKVINSKLDGWK